MPCVHVHPDSLKRAYLLDVAITVYNVRMTIYNVAMLLCTYTTYDYP